MAKKSHAPAKPIPVAVIGLGCFFPRASSSQAYWHLLYHGKDAIEEVPASHWSAKDYFDSDPARPDHVYCRRGGFLPRVEFDPTEFGIPPSNLEATDTSQLFALMAAKTALESAGYPCDADFDRDRTAVILGVTGTQELVIPLGTRLSWPQWQKALEAAHVSPAQTRQVMDALSRAFVGWQENSFPGLLGNVVAGRICNRLGLNGTNCVVDAACASSMGAIHMALLELYTGRSRMVVTGGVDTLNDIFMHMCFARTQILSPTGDARPFAKQADGTVLGEGVGLLVLKRLPDAERDGDQILAVIKGIGTSSDGKSQSIYAPRAEGQLKALQQAYQLAGVRPASVDLIEAHGTGTRVGDKIEVSALKMLFGGDETERHCALGSVKSMIGHTKAAAGAAGLIKTVLALQHKVLPPTLKAEAPDPDLELDRSPFYLNTRGRPWIRRAQQPRRAGVSAFGFGGSNFHMVLEEYRPDRPAVAWDGSLEIAALAADSLVDLRRAAADLRQRMTDDAGGATPAALAFATRQNFDVQRPHRLLLLLQRDEDQRGVSWNTEAAFAEALEALDAPRDDGTWFGAHGFYGRGPQTGQVAFLFPGQGSQYLNMGRDWAAWFPEALAAIENAEAAFGGAPRLSERIFPIDAHDPDRRAACEEALRDTAVAQPAIGAVSVAMERTLRRFGLTPAFTCGHSYGELCALYSAGWFDEATLHRLSVLRGRLMAEAGGGAEAPNGAMLAVRAPLDELESLLGENDLDLVLANRNSPSQGVLSGTVEAIAQAAALCKARKFRTLPLPVSAAFHSRLVSPARAPFAEALAGIKLRPTDTMVFSNTSGAAYPRTARKIREILADHLLKPVNFVDEVVNMHAQGARIFVEVGPKTVLSGLVRQILKQQPHYALATDGSSGQRFGVLDLATLLCQLAALGCPVDLNEWEAGQTHGPRSRMRIPICGANPRPQVAVPPNAAVAQAPKPLENFERPHAPAAETSAPMQRPPHHPSDGIPAAAQPAPPAPPQPTTPPAAFDKAESDIMPNSQTIPESRLTEALSLVQQGLASLQALQSQTVAAHQKFLETQQQASATLQEMMASARRFAESALGLTIPAAPAPVAVSSLPVAAPESDATAVDVPRAANRLPAQVEPPPAPLPDAAAPSVAATQTLLAVVSELTGYPVEMLDLGLDLESDLGIDSIKRVEILSTLEEKLPGMTSLAPDQMAEVRTLRQVADLLDNAAASDRQAIPESHATAATPHPTQINVVGVLMEVVSDLTGYPAEMLAPEMDIESDLGIDSIKRVEILAALEDRLPDLPPVAPDEMAALRTLAEVAARLAPTSAGDTLSGDTSAAPAPDAPADAVLPTLVAVVSELTGYPAEMLTPEMDVEADLGIDSIKRVEILAALEDRLPGLPAVTPDEMAPLKKLGEIARRFAPPPAAEAVPAAAERRPAAVASTGAATEGSAAAEPASPLSRRIVQLEERPLAPGGELRLAPHGRVFITTDKSGLCHALTEALASQGVHTVQISADILTHRETLPQAAGLIILGDPEGPTEADHARDSQLVRQAFALMRHLGQPLCDAAQAGGAFLVTVSRMDGRMGFGPTPPANPMQGGLAGLCKTAALEWPAVPCHAVDVAADWQDNAAIARRICAELCQPTEASRCREVGLRPDGRCLPTLADRPLEASPGESGATLAAGDLVVVSGGARGVTAAATLALARTRPLKLVLLGRSPQDQIEPDWLAGLSDEAALKRALAAHSEGRPTPQSVEARYRQIVANREIAANLTAIAATGAEVRYLAVDIRDAEKVRAAIQDVRLVHGPVRAVIHGAGVLQDSLIVDKTPAQFDRVFATKVTGFVNLMDATAQDPLKWIVVFSSVAARFGNPGQADYAAANEALNKLAAAERTRRPDCRVRAINWGPWNGGMVTPSLRKAFARRGLPLISMAAGTQALVQELAHAAAADVEVILASAAAENSVDHWAAAGAASSSSATEPVMQPAFQSEVDLHRYPVLDHHRLNGRPVVPLALMAEWFGHGALHNHPGFILVGLEDMRLLKGIVLDGTRRHAIRVLAGQAQARNGHLLVPLELRDGHASATGALHCRATALLAESPPPPPTFAIPAALRQLGPPQPADAAYHEILFHGRGLQGLRRISPCTPQGMLAEISPAPSPAKWIQEPPRSQWVADPLVLDCAFQMASIWCFHQTGRVSLPSYAHAYRQYCRRFPQETIQAVLQVKQATPHKMVGDFAFLDRHDRLLATLQGFEAVMDEHLMRAFKPERSHAA